VARAVEHASWDAGDQRRLSTRVAEILDVVAEADYRARSARQKAIRAKDIDVALAGRRKRHSGDEDQIMRVIRDGALLVSTTGAVVGQINGTAVYDTGDHAFGVPTRLTARTWVGKSGVVNIDREVELSGQIHDKGTLIMIGILGDRYAQQRPLALSASLTFEQSYDLVEGDSASCAEFFAILSSLSGLKIHQGIAVTGSLNQQGEVQPVGGVNEKIEGMYRVCKMRGLTGDQGVMIPRRNARNLMLPLELVEDIEAGRFHVWAIDNVDEGIELLTGVPAGRRRRDGAWEPGTVNARVEDRLAEMARDLKPLKPDE
jgi:predicted ATP-dependent protease